MSPARRVDAFIGRDQALSEVRDLLGSSRLVTVVGPGGIGKTRLATELVDRAARAFPDGVAVVELANVEDGREVGPAMAMALGAPDVSMRSAAQRIAGHLAGRRTLVLVDNCEHVLADTADLLAELLEAADGLSVVATSREPLGLPGEQVYPLGPLTLPPEGRRHDPVAVDGSEAVRLLADRARSFDPRFAITEANRPAVVQLCERLDGLPLAIELAAARLRTLSVEQVLTKLDERFSLLTGGTRVGLPRHRTLWALVDWSHDLCAEDERLLWARLSVFPGTFDLDAVEAVCADEHLPRRRILDVLDQLVGKSIVLAEHSGLTMRYRMLVTVREYGVSRLEERGERATMRCRHRNHYLAITDAMVEGWCGPEQPRWLAVMRREHANLTAALEWSASTPGEEQVAARLIALLRYHWVTGRYLSDGRRWGERVLALDPSPTVDRGAALWTIAWVCILQGDGDEAKRLLDECHEIAELLGDDFLRAYAQHWSAVLLYAEGDPGAAIPLFQVALPVYEDVGRYAAVLTALFQLGLAQTYGATSEEALETCDRVLRVSGERGEKWTRAHGMWVAGLNHWHRGDLATAMASTRGALEIAREFEDGICTALTVELVANLSADAELYERAAMIRGAARAVWGRLGTSIEAFGPGLAADSMRMEHKVDAVLGRTEAERIRAAQAELSILEAIELALDERRSGGGSRSGSGPLTSRELEVAQLVAEGLSNRAIADRLVISPRTVDGHVERILGKLGFSSRTQVAAWATVNAAPSA